MNTRQRLVDATSECLRDVGLPGATARVITGRAGANLSAIPYHFGTKDALVAEAMLADARALVAPVLEVLGSDGPPVDRLSAAVLALTEAFDEHRDHVPTYLTAVASVPQLDAVRIGLEDLLHQVRDALAGTITVLRDEGQVSSWVEPDAMAALIVSVVNGVLVGAQADPGGPDHRAVAGQFLLLLAGARS